MRKGLLTLHTAVITIHDTLNFTLKAVVTIVDTCTYKTIVKLFICAQTDILGNRHITNSYYTTHLVRLVLVYQ